LIHFEERPGSVAPHFVRWSELRSRGAAKERTSVAKAELS